ncbi:hypothetical protein TrVFT333_003914 [Trichoderma virens FT-333]|nr:hypothetical protein TrVFT333_003914 [Trichoderma virens FT-333]
MPENIAPEPDEKEPNDLRITFHDASHPSGRAGRSNAFDRDQTRSLSRKRSLSRNSATSRRDLPSSPYSGVQIEYRTLSIHVSESRNVDSDNLGDLKAPKKDGKEEYFSNLTFHELEVDQLMQQLNVSQETGLSESSAQLRLQRDGKNTLPHPKTNYLKRSSRMSLAASAPFCGWASSSSSSAGAP